MNLIDYGSHVKIVDRSLTNKLLDNTYRDIGSRSGRDYRRAKERAQKKLAKKTCFITRLSQIKGLDK